MSQKSMEADDATRSDQLCGDRQQDATTENHRCLRIFPSLKRGGSWAAQEVLLSLTPVPFKGTC